MWGGYASLTLSHPVHIAPGERPVQVSELAAALMAWGEITPRASYFLEWDVAKRTSETWSGREAEENLMPVRLYLEYAANDLLRIRVGRFLTPIGEWNEIHAEPLTWTPIRPLATFRPFAKSLTGLLVAGQTSVKGHDAGYALFWAPGLDFDNDVESGEESQFVRAVGGRVAAEVHPGLIVGLSAARERRTRPFVFDEPDGLPAPPGRAEDQTDRTLLGGDLHWTGSNAEVMAEGTWLTAEGPEPYEGGAYVLGAFRLTGPLWGVGKGEVYSPVDGRRATMGYTGLTYRGGRHLVIKIGRQFANHSSRRIPDGWFLSFSSLF